MAILGELSIFQGTKMRGKILGVDGSTIRKMVPSSELGKIVKK
mgnify:CR=1 FL=1